MPLPLAALLVLLFGLALFIPAPLEYRAVAVSTVLNTGLTWHRDTGRETSLNALGHSCSSL